MAVTALNLTTSGSNADQSTYTTASITPAPNKLVLVWVAGVGSAAVNAPTVTGAGLTWTTVTTITYTTGGFQRMTLFRGVGASPTAGSLTIDFGGQTLLGASWSVVQLDGADISGTNGSGAIINSGSMNGTATTLSVTPTNEFYGQRNAVFAGFHYLANSAATQGAGFIKLANHYQDTPVSGLITEYKARNDSAADATWSSSVPAVGLAVVIKATATETTETNYTASGDDDAYQSAAGVDNGTVYTTSNTIAIGSNSHVGIRFPAVDLPKDVYVKKAYLRFQKLSNYSGTGTLTGTLYGENADTAAVFSATANNISNRARTTASYGFLPSDATWENPGIEVTDIVRSIQSRTGWRAGNAIAFIYMSGGSGPSVTPYAYNYNNGFYKSELVLVTETYPKLDELYEDFESNTLDTSTFTSSVYGSGSVTINSGVLNMNTFGGSTSGGSLTLAKKYSLDGATQILQVAGMNAVSNYTLINGAYPYSPLDPYVSLQFEGSGGVYTLKGIVNVDANGAGNQTAFTYTLPGASSYVRVRFVKTNLVPNPSFETSLTGWEDVQTGVAIARDTTEKYSGLASMRVYNDGTTPSGYKYITTPSNVEGIPVVGGSSYTLQFRAKSSQDLSGLSGYDCGISWFDGVNNQLGINWPTFNPSTSWSQHSFTVTAPAGAEYAALLLGRYDGGSETYKGHSMWYDNVQFEQASSASSYSDGNFIYVDVATTYGAWSLAGTINLATYGIPITRRVSQPSFSWSRNLTDPYLAIDRIGEPVSAPLPAEGNAAMTATGSRVAYDSPTFVSDSAMTASGYMNAFGSAQIAGDAGMIADRIAMNGNSSMTASGTVNQLTIQKSYVYKVYDPDWNYLGTWNDVVSNFGYSHEINSAGPAINVTLARNSDSLTQNYDSLATDSGDPLITDDGTPLAAETKTANAIGPGTTVDLNLNVKVYEFSSDSDTIEGELIFTGYVSRYASQYGSNETTEVTLFSYGADLDQYVFEVDGATRVAMNSLDPSSMAKAALDYFNKEGGLPTYTPGVPGSIYFNGNDNNHVRLGSTNLGLTNPNVFTFSFWFYPTSSVNTLRTIWSAENTANAMQIDHNGSTNEIRLFVSGTVVASTTASAINLNQWNHITFTKNGTAASSVAQYTNGTAQTTVTNAAFTLADPIAPRRIGGRLANSSVENFVGYVSDILVYDRVLSAAEVSSLKNGTRPVDAPKLDMPMHENHGIWTYDKSITARRATLQGESMWTDNHPQYTATNLIRNPSLEANTSTWNVINGGTIGRVSDAKYGSWSGMYTHDGLVGTKGVFNSVISTGVKANTPYTFSTYVKADAGTSLQVSAYLFNSSGGGGAGTDKLLTATGEWQRVDLLIPAKSDAAQFQSYIYSLTTGEGFLWDGVMLEEGASLNDYYDGSTTDTLDYTYGWTGSASNSGSYRLSNGTILETNTTTSYTFNLNTTLEVIKKCLELAPTDWYFYYDPAQNLLNFRPRPTAPDHYFYLGKHILGLDLEKYIEDLTNVVYFTGGALNPFVQDVFDGTAGASLTSRQGSIGAQWTLVAGDRDIVISSGGRARSGALGTAETWYVSSGESLSDDYTISYDILWNSNAGNLGVMGRMDGVTTNGYLLRMTSGATVYFELFRRVSGTWTLLQQVVVSPTAGTMYGVKLEMIGNNIKGYIDGKVYIDVTDNNIPSGRRTGLYTSGTSTDSTATHIDNLRATSEANANTNIFRKYVDSTSIANYRRGLKRITDNRVHLKDSADLIVSSEMNRTNEPRYRSTITITNSNYPIRSIKLGQLIGFRNFGNFVDQVVMQVVRIDYTPDAVTLQLDTLPPSVPKRIEDIKRNLQQEEVSANPDAPTT